MAMRLQVMLMWLGFFGLTLLGVCHCSVTCNEYDTCFPVEKQVNMTESIRAGKRHQVCFVATSAMDCLDEARKDCDDVRYQNLPQYIVKELDDKRNNMSAYTTTYCGNNGGDANGVNLAVMVGGTLLFVLLCVN